MGLGNVIPTISNTIGAVIVGWGVSSLYVSYYLVTPCSSLTPYTRQPLRHALHPSRGVLYAIYE